MFCVNDDPPTPPLCVRRQGAKGATRWQRASWTSATRAASTSRRSAAHLPAFRAASRTLGRLSPSRARWRWRRSRPWRLEGPPLIARQRDATSRASRGCCGRRALRNASSKGARMRRCAWRAATVRVGVAIAHVCDKETNQQPARQSALIVTRASWQRRLVPSGATTTRTSSACIGTTRRLFARRRDEPRGDCAADGDAAEAEAQIARRERDACAKRLVVSYKRKRSVNAFWSTRRRGCGVGVTALPPWMETHARVLGI